MPLGVCPYAYMDIHSKRVAFWTSWDADDCTKEAQDGSWHSFLLKGRDDLRLDGRIMQLLRMVPRLRSVLCWGSKAMID